jgi:hypothetical protein
LRERNKVHIEGLDVVRHGLAAGEGRARDGQAERPDGLQHAQARLRAVLRHHDHLDERRFAGRAEAVEAEQRAHEREAGAGRERLVFAIEHVAAVRLDAADAEDLFGLGEVEESARGDADDEGVGEIEGHGRAP